MPLYVKFTKKGNDTVAKLTLIKKEGYYHKVQKVILTNDLATTLVKIEDRWVEVSCSEGEINVLANTRLAGIQVSKATPLYECSPEDQ